MLKRRFTHPLVAVLVLVAMLCQGTWVLAGTTGSLSGTVTDSSTSTPLAQATVTATSPSQTVSTTTDNGGHFTFASLAPDTYTISVEKPGFDPISQAGINVFADQSQQLTLATRKALREIGRVTSRAATDLVKPGTTADVYSVNALQQDKFSSVGGGGGLNNAYSAIATVPGAYVPNNQVGYFQTIHIRGGDYDQVGYELDGVPVNRSFDNYPSGTASSLGEQELQVYTGAAPANAEGQGLSGFINQVIRTGTYPGFANADVGVGGPAFYHKASFEFGGATPNRNFSYYVGLGGYNQDFRYIDQFNGDYAQPFGPITATLSPAGGCGSAAGINYTSCYANGFAGPGGYTTSPFTDGNFAATINDRDSVVNLHFGIPHHKDGNKDDVQLLYVNNYIQTAFYSSPNDITPQAAGCPTDAFTSGCPAGIPYFADSLQYNGQTGKFLPANASSLISPYFFPSTPTNRAFQSAIPDNLRDTYQNNQDIFKIQYQKNFSSSAYFRLYGYTYYSNWLQNGPDFTYWAYNQNVQDAVSSDYELSSHTRGISGTFADQINAQNLVQLQGSFTTASTLRDNNTQMLNDGLSGSRKYFAVLVDSTNPTSGICYNVSTGTPTQANCNTYTSHPAATALTYSQVAAGSIPNYSNLTCGSGPCQYFVIENGQYGTYNTVKPNFTAASLTDTFKPNDKLSINLGLRYDLYQFDGSDTTGTAARALEFNSFDKTQCVYQGNIVAKTVPFTDSCTTQGAGYTNPQLQNVPSQVNTYPVFEPRLGFTYTVTPDTVVRASYGRYSQAPNTAFEQYNSLQQNLAYSLLGASFYKYGFTTPGHQVDPEESNNYDLSIEHHVKGTDLSFKLTPFYRYTQNQIQNFFLDQASGFVSGLNADRLTARGFEFQMNKGDFGRDGVAAQMSFTYTNAFAKYNSFANGNTVFTGINNDIATYNGYTSFCATHYTSKQCGSLTAASPNAVPCFTTGGAPDPSCAAGSVANPYYKAPVQGLVDPNGNYAPYTIITGPIGSSADSYLVPYVAQLITQYKKGPWAFTPALTFTGGQRYGMPETSPGIDPASGCGALAGSTSGDPRYRYGAAGGSPYDATTCPGLLNAIPNPQTGRFDGIGDFVNPNNLSLNAQLSYQASKNITLVATFANILNNCFGGSNEAWTNGGSQVCSYGLVDAGNSNPFVGNVYNPGAKIQPVVAYPYQRSYGVFNTNSNSVKQPFGVFLDARVKL